LATRPNNLHTRSLAANARSSHAASRRARTTSARAQTGDTTPQTREREVGLRNEAQLVADAKRGDGEAFGELCRMHRALILRVARRITGNIEDAQDAVQDSLLRAYVAIRSFDERAKFRTWLTRITINSCLMMLRKRRPNFEVSSSGTGFESEMVETPEPTDAAPDPEDALLLRERRRVVRAAVNGLPKLLRTVIEAGHLEERSPVEIATALGISHGAAKARQFRAIAALRKSRRLVDITNARRSALDYEDAA
jgi:RNA polymerase sigma-70 factor, ECF subfamily